MLTGDVCELLNCIDFATNLKLTVTQLQNRGGWTHLKHHLILLPIIPFF